MRRREFIILGGGAAITWPLTVLAQQPIIPVVGFLSSSAPESIAHLMPIFRQSLGETGYIEGRNVAIEYRWAEGKYDRMPAMAAELLGSRAARDRGKPHPSSTGS